MTANLIGLVDGIGDIADHVSMRLLVVAQERSNLWDWLNE